MARYYVNDNAQPNGDHEVHVETSARLPVPANHHYLGEFSTCAPAVTKAQQRWPQVNGCNYC